MDLRGPNDYAAALEFLVTDEEPIDDRWPDRFRSYLRVLAGTPTLNLI